MLETTIRVAGVTVRAVHFYPAFVKFARGYLSEDEPDFTVTVTEELIKKEAEESLPEVYPDFYLETVVIYRLIAERLPEYDAFVFHGAVLAVDGKAYAFTAPSGTGKTTHIRLWHEVFGERVHVLNGDKPVVRKIGDTFFACGTPWQGKENYGTKEDLPLAGVAFLHRGAENRAEPVGLTAAAVPFLAQVYLPSTPAALERTMTLADGVLSQAKTLSIHVNMDPSAAKVAAEGFGIKP